MELAAIATKDVVAMASSGEIDRAMELMDRHHFHHLPVIDDGRLVGMVSDRDLLQSVGGLSSRDRIPAMPGPALIGPSRVKEIMTREVQTLPPTAGLQEGVALMLEGHFGAIPLVEGDGVVGIVTASDLLECFRVDRPIVDKSSWKFQKVSKFMAKDVVTIAPTATVATALKQMQSRGVRHLPVASDAKLAGIVSDRDVRKSLASLFIESAADDLVRDAFGFHLQIKEIMHPDVQTTTPSTPLIEVADHLLRQSIGALPVVQDDRVIGMISEVDLLRAVLEALNTQPAEKRPVP